MCTLVSTHLSQLDLHARMIAAFMLTFEKGFDNFYANVWHLSGTKSGVIEAECR